MRQALPGGVPRQSQERRHTADRSATMPAVKRPVAALTATLAVLAAAPAAAQGATLAVGGACFASGEPIPVTGTGFAPKKGVRLTGDANGFVVADDAGNIAGEVRAFTNEKTPQSLTITAVQDEVELATAPFSLIRRAFDVDVDGRGKPTSRVRWRFAGFPAGRPVYVHVRFKGRTLRNYRFGVAQGPCGTLTARAPRLPVKRARTGNYQLKFDDRRTYSRTAPGSLYRVFVFTRFGSRR